MDDMNRYFNDLWWLSDDEETMKEFVEAIKDYVNSNKGDVIIELIDLHDFGFERGHIYIAYDDCTGAMEPTIFPSAMFIKYIQEVYNQSPELEPQEFWVPRLEIITDR